MARFQCLLTVLAVAASLHAQDTRNADHKLGVMLENVTVDNQRPDQTHKENADIKTVAGAAPVPCENRFPPMAAIPIAPAAGVTVPAEDATLYVAASGAGDYYSIQHAIDVAPTTGAVISVAPGVYRERLKITKPNIVLRSPYTDANKTVIAFDDSAAYAGGTTRSAAVEVRGDDFLAENLTFSNDYNRTHEQASQGSQALALAVFADRAVFRNMRILGNQDTLYTASRGCMQNVPACAPTRQYFVDSYIEGNVDFIFGDGNSVFENCEIHSTPHNGGYITAQSKSHPDQDSTYVFNHYRLTAAPNVGTIWLGRPWRQYASVVYGNTEMGAQIGAAGWREWHDDTHYLETAFYAEYNSSGPGAHPGEREPYSKPLAAAEAARYETRKFLAGPDGWDPTAKR